MRPRAFIFEICGALAIFFLRIWRLLRRSWRLSARSWEPLGGILGGSWEDFGDICGLFGSYLGAWRAYFKRLVEFLKNHQKPCKVLQKSKFGGLNIEPRSPKIALRSSLGVTFVEQDRPRASKSVPSSEKEPPKTPKTAPRWLKWAARALPRAVRGQSTGGPAECAVPAEGGGR